jgi:DnaJ-class molecular chaperone
VEEYCGACGGRGLVENSKQVKVRIPPGVVSALYLFHAPFIRLEL